MWYPHTVTTPPASEPLTLADARVQCRIDAADTTYDTELTTYIAAARDQVEAITGTKLVEQTVALRCDSWADLARLPMAPLSAVIVDYTDAAGDPQTLSTDVYEARLFGLSPSIVLKSGQSWPSIETGSLITVTATVGYDEVPPTVLQAIRLNLANMFDQRETGDISNLVASLLVNHRIWP